MTCGCSPAASGGGTAVADYVALGSRHPVLQSVLQIANPAAAHAIRRARAEFAPDVAYVSMFEMHLSPSVLSELRNVPTVLSIAYYKPVCPNGLKLLPRRFALYGATGRRLLARRVHPSSALAARPPRVTRESAAGFVAWQRSSRSAAGSSASCATAESIRRGRPGRSRPPSALFRRAPAAEPLFVFTGRLAREKGVATLLHALALARGQGSPARLRVVGDGPLRPALERLTLELGLRDAVEFTGWLSLERVEAQLADAWALVAPSLWAEPLGLTALEAVVRGLPVIASATGGLAETVEHGVSGLLFPNGDVDALAACLVEVASGRALVGGVPSETVARLQAQHDVRRHITWLRTLFAEVTA